MTQTFSLADVLQAALDGRSAVTFTAMPGIVQAYNAELQVADVQPGVKQAFEGEEGERVREVLPIVPDVPVIFFGSGEYSITVPVAKGAPCLLVFANCSLDVWLAEGGVVDPLTDQRNHLSDAVAIIGLRPRKQAIKPATPSDAMVLTAPKVLLGSASASQAVALKSDLETIKPAIVAAIDAQIVVLTAGLPLTAAALAEMEALKVQLTTPDGWPVCASKVKAE